MARKKTRQPTPEEMRAVGRLFHRLAEFWSKDTGDYEGSLGAMLASRMDTFTTSGAEMFAKLLKQAKEWNCMDKKKEG
ncbi:MAG: hypothetical protein LBQ12_00860 [Deltaproteobacteria bacterium]|jgi:hypothetical protein|nr:hypothetical protein [Deltaproteobacteria bacterium]